MDVSNYEIYNLIIRGTLFLFGSVFWGIRWAITHIQRLNERVAKIEGRCEERQKVNKAEEDKNPPGEE